MKFLALFCGLVCTVAVLVTAQAQTSKNLHQQYCREQKALEESVDKLDDLSPQSKVAELRKVYNEVIANGEKVKSTESEIRALHQSRLDKATDDLKKAMKAVPNDATIDQGRKIIRDQVQEFKAAQSSLAEDLDCD